MDDARPWLPSALTPLLTAKFRSWATFESRFAYGRGRCRFSVAPRRPRRQEPSYFQAQAAIGGTTVGIIQAIVEAVPLCGDNRDHALLSVEHRHASAPLRAGRFD